MKRTASPAAPAALAILGLLVAFALFRTAQGGASRIAAGGELKLIEQTIRDCIGWAKNKDFARLYEVIADDPDFLEVHPDPDHALCDGPNSLALESLPELLATIKRIEAAVA